jgi:raffinose/stachyose/melibiose transport system substrate-binding protein
LTLPGTFDELLVFCGEAQAAGTTPIVIGEGSNFMGWVFQQAMIADYIVANPDLAEEYQSGERSFTDPAFVDRLRALKDAKDAGCFNQNAEAVDFPTSMTMFMEGEGAIWSCASFCVPDLLGAFGPEAVDQKVGFLPISYAETAVWVYGADHWGVYLPKTGDAEREAAALAYAEYITGDGYSIYLEGSREPSRYPNHSMPDPDVLAIPVQTSLAALNEYPAAAALDPRLICSFGDLFTFLSELFVGQRTAEEVAETMQRSFEQSCQDLGIPGW